MQVAGQPRSKVFARPAAEKRDTCFAIRQRAELRLSRSGMLDSSPSLRNAKIYSHSNAFALPFGLLRNAASCGCVACLPVMQDNIPWPELPMQNKVRKQGLLVQSRSMLEVHACPFTKPLPFIWLLVRSQSFHRLMTSFVDASDSGPGVRSACKTSLPSN